MEKRKRGPKINQKSVVVGIVSVTLALVALGILLYIYARLQIITLEQNIRPQGWTLPSLMYYTSPEDGTQPKKDADFATMRSLMTDDQEWVVFQSKYDLNIYRIADADPSLFPSEVLRAARDCQAVYYQVIHPNPDDYAANIFCQFVMAKEDLNDFLAVGTGTAHSYVVYLGDSGYLESIRFGLPDQNLRPSILLDVDLP